MDIMRAGSGAKSGRVKMAGQHLIIGIDDLGGHVAHDAFRLGGRIGHDFAGNRARGSILSHHGPTLPHLFAVRFFWVNGNG
ncbi:hypothetical protein NKI04_03235 [Mesorhizobium sp. M0814]|uniref:hypothetical protein n=1 Tax=Mesorhizobium sp. M0814 TaxID=2957004 RepID=UPI003338C01C